MSETKIKSWAEISQIVVDLHRQGKKTVFSNGCFDILHAGHVLYLQQARDLGDVLIIGLNSDQSIARLKGVGRPIVPESERSIVLAALACVDYVVIFGADTPYELIEKIEPDFLVKGGDWKVEDIVGSEIVLAKGGKVLSLPYQNGLSTTSIIERIAETLPRQDI